jgi:Leucine-rich repeat (LRR) protein
VQPASSTTQQSNYGTTTTSTTSTSSTNADRPPTVRTAATNQRKVTVRRDKDSSEESTETEKNTDKKSQPKPGKRDAYKKAHKKGQAQYQAQRGLPRFSEKSESATAAKLSHGASSACSTATTSDAPRPRPDSSEAYRLQLDEWGKAAVDIPMEYRKEVKARIEAYLESPESKNWKLDFSGLSLTTVPPLPPDLETLLASGNPLCALPEHLPVGLQELYVSDNQLSGLPEHLPEGLQKLYVGFNQLIALPKHLPERLQYLYVGHNQLSALPEHLPEGLQRLCVSYNQLRSLPPGLLNVRDEINLEGNPLPTTVLDRLQQRINAPDCRGPRIRFSMTAHEAPLTLDSVRPLTDAIQNWLGKESTPWAAFVGEQGATEFSLFLDKLALSIIGRNPAFRTTFQTWLREMAAHPSLRAHLFAVAQGATASCQDRVMLTANDMANARLLFQVEHGDYDQRLPELIAIARGMFRLEKLEAIARKKAASLMFVDEIEVTLAYQVKLCAPLRLPLVVDEMAYFKVSGVSDNDLLAAEATVKEMENREFKDFLLTWTPWLEAQKKGSGLSEEAARAQQFALWDAEYEQPLARLEETIDAIDRQLNNDSRLTTSTTEQTHRLQVERQRLTAQKNALVSGARKLSEDIARRIAVEGNVSLPVSASLLEPVWDNDGGYVGDSADAPGTCLQAPGT